MPRQSWPTLADQSYALERLADVVHKRLWQASAWHSRLDRDVQGKPPQPLTIDDLKGTLLGLEALRDLIESALNEEIALAKRYAASYTEIGAVLGMSKQAASTRANKDPREALEVAKQAASRRDRKATRKALGTTKPTASTRLRKPPIELSDLVTEFCKRRFVPPDYDQSSSDRSQADCS